MDHRSDPVRWLDAASDAPDDLRRVLRSAEDDGGGADALSSLAAKLPLAGAGPLPGAAAAGATKKVILSWKLAVWIAGAAATATNAALIHGALSARESGAIQASVTQVESVDSRGSAPAPPAQGPSENASLQGTSPSPEPADSGAQTLVPPRKTPAPSHEVVATTPKTATPTGPDGAGARTGPDGAKARTGPDGPGARTGTDEPGSAKTSTDDGSLGAEARLLSKARDVMARDPAKALREAEAHRAAFTDGALSEEREVLRVEALLRLGKLDEAARAAAQLRVAHPGSTHLTRIERLLAAAAKTPNSPLR
ncbi:MAG: hypothetical protein U0441_21885 [Polyangiaceae bacterium]